MVCVENHLIDKRCGQQEKKLTEKSENHFRNYISLLNGQQIFVCKGEHTHTNINLKCASQIACAFMIYLW